MARRKQKSAFLCAVQEMPETTGDILEDVWGGLVAIGHRIWRPVAARPILWFLMIYFGLITAAIGWRYAEGNSGGFGILNWAFWEKPSGQSESGAALNGTEGIRNLVWSLATLVGGAAAGIGLILAARRTKAANDQAEAALQQSETAFQSLVTERFTRAVEQLGHEKRAVRLGAIYALERIAKDSPRDRDTIVETLAAYIREHAPWPPPDEKGKPLDDAALEVEKARTGLRPPIDIAAALTIICRLLPTGYPLREKLDLRRIDLRGLDAPQIDFNKMRLERLNLRGANLSGASLSGVDLSWADLSTVDLDGADIREANLTGAGLGDAILNGADLGGANLMGADMRGTRLAKVNLNGARMRWVKMNKAYLGRASLSGAILRQSNLSGATLFDANLSGTDLSLVDLSGTDLTRANLSGADLKEVQLLTQKQIDGIRYHRDHPPKNLPAGLTLPEPYDL